MLEQQIKAVLRVGLGGLLKFFRFSSGFNDLIEREMLGLIEVGIAAIVNKLDDLRKL